MSRVATHRGHPKVSGSPTVATPVETAPTPGGGANAAPTPLCGALRSLPHRPHAIRHLEAAAAPVEELVGHATVIEAPPACLEDGGRTRDGRQRGQGAVVVRDGLPSRVDLGHSIQDRLEGDIAVSPLASELASARRGLPEQGIHRGEGRPVLRDGVPPVCLVDCDLPLLTHVEPTLLRVNVGLRCHPATRVDAVADGAILEVLPIHDDGDGVLGLDAVEPPVGDPRARVCSNSHRASLAVHAPLVVVNVVRVQVVGDIGAAARPRLEGFQLLLRLRHVRPIVREGAELADAIPRVEVDGVEALVELGHAEHVFPPRGLDKLQVLLQLLHRRLRDHYMHAPLDASHGYFVVCVIRGEDDGQVAGPEGRRRFLVGVSLHHAIPRKGVDHRRVDAFVRLSEHPLHVRAESGQLLPVRAAHAEAADLTPCPEVQADQRQHACALVRLRRAAIDEACDVLAGADHEAPRRGRRGRLGRDRALAPAGIRAGSAHGRDCAELAGGHSPRGAEHRDEQRLLTEQGGLGNKKELEPK
mmetsp:Transcript_94033/g.271813  ORF Transcript_94033/g.271813 Transcript_94033/m.271813 type:complete len:529 (-) Transcript_94033:5-1591(-)